VGGVNMAIVQRHWALVTGGVALVIVAIAVTAYMARSTAESSPELPQTSPAPVVLPQGVLQTD
jgi:hypothetical protein